MPLLKFIRKWFSLKKRYQSIADTNINPALARDMGVTFTRIRLPSGAEIVIVERVHADQ